MATTDRAGQRIRVGLHSWSMCLGCGGYLRELSRNERMIQARCEACGDRTERRVLRRRSSRNRADDCHKAPGS